MVARKIVKIILMLSLIVFSPMIWAQAPPLAETASAGPRQQLATIVFAGLAGAVLGLSTLSFYGRPQDRLSNIAVGFAIGIISGAVYATYKTATQPYSYEASFSITEEQRLAELSFSDLSEPAPLKLEYQWTF